MTPPPDRRALLLGLAGLGLGAALPAFAQGEPAAEAPPTPRAWVNFVINVQNFRYPDSSAETVEKLCAIFERHGVRGDFYLTGTMAELYAQSAPRLLGALAAQGLGYHTRPPHPLFDGFEGPLRGLQGEALTQRIAEYESRSLDLATGQLRPDQPGGFLFVKERLGKAPAVVSVPTRIEPIKLAACAWYQQQGARGVVWFHKARALGDDPYELRGGLLSRPSDLALYEWQAAGEPRPNLWWNRYAEGNPREEDRPAAWLERQLRGWTGRRPPFVTVLIHENNVTRRGRDPWLHTFWDDTAKSAPRSPPYDLQAPDPSRPRSAGEQRRILEAYEELVAYAARQLAVRTMDEIATMAGR